jgi:energy-coupling factor transport system ATP-binding protein
MKVLKAEDITFKYGKHGNLLFSNLCFNLREARIVAITGPSGSGKSTLGYCLAGVIPDLIEGVYDGKVERKGQVGIVFQDPDTQIFFSAVEDELAFAPENLCVEREEIGDRIGKVLKDLGIEDLKESNPSRLSGGQKQLVALGSVLTLVPKILILDETLSQLDNAARLQVKRLLSELKAGGVAIVLIEHEKQNYDIADEVWLLEDGKMRMISNEGKTAGEVK